jgi:hypothetical protein
MCCANLHAFIAIVFNSLQLMFASYSKNRDSLPISQRLNLTALMLKTAATQQSTVTA